MTAENILHTKKYQKLIENYNIKDSLSILADEFKGKVVFSTSLGLEDQVITHIIFENDIPINVFTLDTGRLFEQTYNTLEETQKRYGKKIYVAMPNWKAVEDMVNKKGMYSFYESIENRKECCDLRKVQPLDRMLNNQKLWVTGIRSDQSRSRQDLSRLEYVPNRGLIKYHPLLHWSLKKVKTFIDDHQIPYNPMHNQGFVSIGCEPCTKAIRRGEDPRAGRWWWEQDTVKECGLHR